MKAKCIWILCLLCTAGVWAQQIVVVAAESLQPIPGVVISNKEKKVLTNINGQADLDVFSDKDTLQFTAPNYRVLKLIKKRINGHTVSLTRFVGLDEVVISASKFKQEKRDVPQKIINISAKEVGFTNPQTSADLLAETGNVFIQKSQLGGGSPMIRGFSTNRLLMTVDGVRMNNAIFRGGNLQNSLSVNPLSLQNTEITLGAGSVVYGSDAIGGVISFYTKKPQLSYKDAMYVKAHTLARYASASTEKTVHADVNIGFKKWAFLSSVSFNDYDHVTMGSHGPDAYLRPEYVETVNGVDFIKSNTNPKRQIPTGFNQFYALQKVHFQPKENLLLDVGLHYATTSNYARYDRLIRYEANQLQWAQWYYGPQNWFMGNLQATKHSKSHVLFNKAQLTVAYQHFKESRHHRKLQSEIKTNRTERVQAISVNADLEKQVTSSTAIFYGLEYVYNRIHSEAYQEQINSGVQQESVTRYPNGATWQSVAAYASLKYKPSDKFIFQTGLRYNQIAATANFEENNRFLNLPYNNTAINASAFTGTAGISWMPNSIVQWKLHASTAFRAPNIDDVGKVFDSEPGSVVVPNPNLKSEYAYGGELGLVLNFNDKVVLDFNTYYTFLDDALVRRDYMLNQATELMYNGELSSIQAVQNASKAWIYGLEVGLRCRFSKNLTLKSQYNLIGGTEDDNGVEVPIRHVAPSFGNIHLVWQKQAFTVASFVNFNGTLQNHKLAPSEQAKPYIYATDKQGKPYAPSWYTINLRTQYQFKNDLAVSVAFQNITDQRYKTYSSGIAAPGKQVIIAVNYTL
ncbi:TonB-dependent receptor plug domain-containing protein [Bizionia sediminis]|uniref:TonB-dependent receptor plug domain-containing protein n=1 Tax=Bizionia sediminis TaxID=1737064 RepID=A0ABW5KUV8_9FLAO